MSGAPASVLPPFPGLPEVSPAFLNGLFSIRVVQRSGRSPTQNGTNQSCRDSMTASRRRAAVHQLFLLGSLALLAACAPATGRSLAENPNPAVHATFDRLRDPRPFDAGEYSRRRAALARAMDDGVFVAFGAATPLPGQPPYAQNVAFRYLTGILEPDAGLIIVKRGEKIDERLFVLPRDRERELWEGPRLGHEAASHLSGIRAEPREHFLPALEALVAREGTLHLLSPLAHDRASEGYLNQEEQLLFSLLGRNPATRIRSLAQPLQLLRARKSEQELDMIRRAALISALAHLEAMRSVQPGMNEFEVQALIEYLFRRNGADGPAYSSIVGSGPNSNILHYTANNRFMASGEVLLLDLGASYRGYAADITRTLPVDGRFTPEQRSIYEIVLEAQKAAEREVRIGTSWSDLERAADAVLEEGLARLGLIEAPGATYQCTSRHTGDRCPQLRLFYMHGLGHGIGLDVHDPEISYFESFQAGSAFTLEPGIYVRDDVLEQLREFPENATLIERLEPVIARFRNTGIRIEDDYLLSEDGLERISAAVPREIDEIEALMTGQGIGQIGRNPEIVEWYRATEEGDIHE